MNAAEIQTRILRLANKKKAKILQGFFKTGPGQYGEGDIFLGITVPILRELAKECRETSINEAQKLLRSEIHEQRLLALFLLIQKFKDGDDMTKKKIYDLYLRNTAFINNWDLVDLSAPNIIGNYLADRPRLQLYDLAVSKSLWERRIAILATFAFIRLNDFADALKISSILLEDEHDLIQKAVGWMLREVGKRDLAREERFLRLYYTKMPRTMLRYAIERFPEGERLKYLKGII